MRLGLTLTGDQLTMADIVRFAGQAEEARFDSVWVTEAWREAFVSLTAIAMQTNRVRIGTAIALTMARSPVLMELAATAVDEIPRAALFWALAPAPRHGTKTGTPCGSIPRPPMSASMRKSCA